MLALQNLLPELLTSYKQFHRSKDLWHTIARFGGYLDRKSDPPPGWQTLWKGWIYVQTILQGVSLAWQFTPS